LTTGSLSASAVYLRYVQVSSHDPMLQQCPHRRVSVTFRLLILRAVDVSPSEYSAAVGARRGIISTAPTIGEYVPMAWRANNDAFRDKKFVTEPTVVKSRATSCVGRCECRNWGALCQVVHAISVVSSTHALVMSAKSDS